ncbi:muramoyltetrapeptide carboxypeptidase [Candidatus Magnetomoraceae bacterium gMMP-15]
MKNRKIPQFPEKLSKGDTIGIIAPASHFNKNAFDKGISIIKSMGFNPLIPDAVFNKDGCHAGTDKQRAELVNKFFADQEIKAIACARGGFGSMKVLKFLDFDSIKQNPKIFIGFSDITVLLNVFYCKCNLLTFHGPMIVNLAEADHATLQSLFNALTTLNIHFRFRSKNPVTLYPGRASGPVMGGNLTSMCHLVGTPFEICFDGRILFLEDRGEALYRIDRMLTQMQLAGCFKKVRGVILGSFEECGPLSLVHLLIGKIFEDYKIPVLAGFECGHGFANKTIPIGLKATLDTDLQAIEF